MENKAWLSEGVLSHAGQGQSKYFPSRCSIQVRCERLAEEVTGMVWCVSACHGVLSTFYHQMVSQFRCKS
jgi:hypothetical protein